MDRQIGDILARTVLQSPEAMAELLDAVGKQGTLLGELPEALRTQELSAAAVRQDPEALEHVPDSIKTEALCLDAVSRDGSALLFVPPALATEAVCEAAVQQDAGAALCLVPDEMKTEAMCLAAVKADGLALDAVPAGMLTPEILAAAALQAGGVEMWEEHATDEVWYAADAEAGDREDCRQSFWDRVPERMRDEVESLLEDAEEAAMKS